MSSLLTNAIFLSSDNHCLTLSVKWTVGLESFPLWNLSYLCFQWQNPYIKVGFEDTLGMRGRFFSFILNMNFLSCFPSKGSFKFVVFTEEAKATYLPVRMATCWVWLLAENSGFLVGQVDHRDTEATSCLWQLFLWSILFIAPRVSWCCLLLGLSKGAAVGIAVAIYLQLFMDRFVGIINVLWHNPPYCIKSLWHSLFLKGR